MGLSILLAAHHFHILFLSLFNDSGWSRLLFNPNLLFIPVLPHSAGFWLPIDQIKPQVYINAC